MTQRAPHLLASLAISLVLLAQPAAAQTRQLSDEQIHTIEYHYKMDQYFAGGCLLGASFGAITGVMTLSGFSVIAAVPYISTGCSVGFLLGGSSMVIGEFLSSYLNGP